MKSIPIRDKSILCIASKFHSNLRIFTRLHKSWKVPLPRIHSYECLKCTKNSCRIRINCICEKMSDSIFNGMKRKRDAEVNFHSAMRFPKSMNEWCVHSASHVSLCESEHWSQLTDINSLASQRNGHFVINHDQHHHTRGKSRCLISPDAKIFFSALLAKHNNSQPVNGRRNQITPRK